MARDSLLGEHDVLAIGSEVEVCRGTRSAGGDGPLLHGDVPLHVEADQPDDRWICFVVSFEPELTVAGPSDWSGVGKPGQGDRLPAGKWMEDCHDLSAAHCTGRGPPAVRRKLEVVADRRLRSGEQL